MSFRDSCESFTAALAFLDVALSESSDTSQSQGSPPALPTLTDGEWNPNLVLDNIGDFSGDAVDTLASDYTSLVTLPDQIQLEASNFDFETIGFESTSRNSKKQKRTSKNEKKLLNYNPNKARNGRRFEIIHLRKEARELELMFQQLKSMQEREDLRLGRTSNAKNRVKKVPAVWEEICKRQLERRLKVERENVLLRKKCEKGRQVARSIERMVRKRLAQQDAARSDLNRPTRRVGIPPTFSSRMTSKIFEELLAGVEASYNEVDSVFEDNSSTFPNRRTRAPLGRDSVKDMQVNLLYGKVMPFQVDAIGDAWWTRWHNYRGQCTTQNEGNTIAEKFGLEMRDSRTNTTATFYDQQVLRRYDDKDRIVIVWRAYIEPLEYDERQVNGMYFLEKGYVLITPYEQDEAADGDNSTFSRVSTCYILTPKSTGRKLRHDSRTTSLVDFVASSVSANMAMIIEMVENMLLDQSIDQCKPH
ncbi:hypothetical protein L915_18165 [Phytophthora nicotianae]|uniref:M96 mating-specific protein family n=1 Tax=Phytophthora nicotianae TaxID=4792 RepID=W2FWR1_PHYNI|nr:hypothetical protein L915_18165 [Phytophthora nicotianae]